MEVEGFRRLKLAEIPNLFYDGSKILRKESLHNGNLLRRKGTRNY